MFLITTQLTQFAHTMSGEEDKEQWPATANEYELIEEIGKGV